MIQVARADGLTDLSVESLARPQPSQAGMGRADETSNQFLGLGCLDTILGRASASNNGCMRFAPVA